MTIGNDGAPTRGATAAALKKDCKLGPDTPERRAWHLNNRLRSSRGKLKRSTKSALSFQLPRTAFDIVRSPEALKALRKGQVALLPRLPRVAGKVILPHRTFGLV